MTQPVVIGDATLYLGDCRDCMQAAVGSLDLGSVSIPLSGIDAVVTDPPYGVNLGNHLAAKDRRTDRLVKDGYSSYDDTPENYRAIVAPVIEAAVSAIGRGLVFGVPPAIWDLPAPTAMGGVYLPAACGRNTWGFSSLVHALLYGRAPNLHLGAKHTAIESTEPAEKNGHPCPKPLSWMRWAVSLATASGETVIDPFMGSGTTGVACAKLGRKFIGIEIEPKYFDIACRRIEQAYAQPDIFVAPPAKPVQDALL